ncbi:MAG: hypothetical protein NTU94_02880 [Planctomycetota bacterium]|nr:hypothetical protein [Planctomycetota bacterium]
MKIEYAGANEGSFQQASEALGRLAEFSISAKHVQRITERLGRERVGERDRDVERMKAGRLTPTHAQPPRVVAVHLDAGKIQVRAEDGGPGVREPHWSDTKVACFLTYCAPTGNKDPQPQPPKTFLDPPRVMRLCQEMHEVRSNPATHPTAAKAPRTPARRFYQAKCRAIVGDGGNWIEPLGQMHFPEWEQILDFLHLLVHLYAAATAAYRSQAKRAWQLYERLLRAAWAGRVQEVEAMLAQQLQRLGWPSTTGPPEESRQVVADTLAYVKRNRQRMDYPRYRRQGLPVTSAAVESLIKQVNHRVKGTEKFWVRGGAEAVLAVRAAYLSEDGRAEAFHDHRPRGRAVGRGRLRPAA